MSDISGNKSHLTSGNDGLLTERLENISIQMNESEINQSSSEHDSKTHEKSAHNKPGNFTHQNQISSIKSSQTHSETSVVFCAHEAKINESSLELDSNCDQMKNPSHLSTSIIVNLSINRNASATDNSADSNTKKNLYENNKHELKDRTGSKNSPNKISVTLINKDISIPEASYSGDSFNQPMTFKTDERICMPSPDCKQKSTSISDNEKFQRTQHQIPGTVVDPNASLVQSAQPSGSNNQPTNSENNERIPRKIHTSSHGTKKRKIVQTLKYPLPNIDQNIAQPAVPSSHSLDPAYLFVSPDNKIYMPTAMGMLRIRERHRINSKAVDLNTSEVQITGPDDSNDKPITSKMDENVDMSSANHEKMRSSNRDQKEQNLISTRIPSGMYQRVTSTINDSNQMDLDEQAKSQYRKYHRGNGLDDKTVKTLQGEHYPTSTASSISKINPHQVNNFRREFVIGILFQISAEIALGLIQNGSSDDDFDCINDKIRTLWIPILKMYEEVHGFTIPVDAVQRYSDVMVQHILDTYHEPQLKSSTENKKRSSKSNSMTSDAATSDAATSDAMRNPDVSSNTQPLTSRSGSSRNNFYNWAIEIAESICNPEHITLVPTLAPSSSTRPSISGVARRKHIRDNAGPISSCSTSTVDEEKLELKMRNDSEFNTREKVVGSKSEDKLNALFDKNKRKFNIKNRDAAEKPSRPNDQNVDKSKCINSNDVVASKSGDESNGLFDKNRRKFRIKNRDAEKESSRPNDPKLEENESTCLNNFDSIRTQLKNFITACGIENDTDNSKSDTDSEALE